MTAPADAAPQWPIPQWMDEELVTVDEDGVPVVVVRFTDRVIVTTAADLCASAGVGPDDYLAMMRGLVTTGFLRPLDDGTYEACAPCCATEESGADE